jgi:RecB family exonuclease
MLVLSGRPGSGKSHEIMEQVRTALSRGAADFRVLVPTATMAAHLRHQMAREGFLLRPSLIQTLSKFVVPWTHDWPEASPAMLELAVGFALEKETSKAFREVAALPGFRACLARLIDEFSSAGYDSRHLARAIQAGLPEAPLAPAFLSVFQEVEQDLARRGVALRSARLKCAADEIRVRGLARIHRLFLDGFYTLSGPELNLIEALRRHADITIALPTWAGSEIARSALAGLGFLERTVGHRPLRSPGRVLVTAQTIEQEADEVARRVLDHVAAGRQFRDIGIVLRTRDPYLPVLRTALERFGIPARMYFAEPLAKHPLIRLMTAAVEAMRDRWDHAATLEVLRMTATGFGESGEGDRFDFAVRERLPGQGLDSLRLLSEDPLLAALLDRLASLETWAGAREVPSSWAMRARALRRLLREPRLVDGVDHTIAAVWRGQAAALDAFETAMQETAAAFLQKQPIPFWEFWDAALVVLRQTLLHIADDRRNVVHVMDVYEARQWELPVVFVCGLLEQQFPLYHSGDPIFSDSARFALERAGLRLSTLADRQREEEFLFEVATTRATGDMVLSYPESNAKGESNLPSFFLSKFPLQPEKSRPVRPQGFGAAPPPRPEPYLEDPRLIDLVRNRHAVLRPTAIENFLQCPFRFFLAHTLRLEEPPARPGDRLTPLAQGTVIHEVLARYHQCGGRLEEIFDRVFEETCARERIPPGCRTELARLKMLRDLRAWLDEARPLEGWTSSAEMEIQFSLAPDIEIRARVDRYDVGPDNRVVVFDYKYSGAQGIRDRIRGHDEGRHIQSALYLLGLVKIFGYTPAGMFYCGLRGEVTVDGWHTGLPGYAGVGTSCTPEALREQLEAARAVTVTAAEEIRRGRVEGFGPSGERCGYCIAHDVCRFWPSVEPALAEGAGE